MSNNNLEQNVHAVKVLSQPEVTKGGKRMYLCINIRYSPFSLKFQGCTSNHDTQAVHTKGISKIIPQ